MKDGRRSWRMPAFRGQGFGSRSSYRARDHELRFLDQLPAARPAEVSMLQDKGTEISRR